MSKTIFCFLVFGNVFLIACAVSPPCNYVQNQGFSCNGIEPSIQYYYHIASRTCQPFMYLGCGGNRNKFPSRNTCMQVCQPGTVPIGQGTRPRPINNIGIGQGTSPGSNNNNNIGQGVRPGPNNNNNVGIGQGAQPIRIGQGTNFATRNNMVLIGNGVETSSTPSIGQGTGGGASIGQGTAPLGNGIGQGTNIQAAVRNTNRKVDVLNPFHPGPVKTNGSWPAPINPPTPNNTRDFINGYAQMCDTTFGVNIQVPTSCGAADSCPEGYQCAGQFCCPLKETVCSQNYESGREINEQEHVPRYAYVPSLKTCSRFSYFGSGGNYNNFKTYNDCMRFCGNS